MCNEFYLQLIFLLFSSHKIMKSNLIFSVFLRLEHWDFSSPKQNMRAKGSYMLAEHMRRKFTWMRLSLCALVCFNLPHYFEVSGGSTRCHEILRTWGMCFSSFVSLNSWHQDVEWFPVCLAQRLPVDRNVALRWTRQSSLAAGIMVCYSVAITIHALEKSVSPH